MRQDPFPLMMLQRPVVKLASRWGVQQDSGLWGESLARQLHRPPTCAPCEKCASLVICVFCSPFNLYDVNEANIIKNGHLNFFTLIFMSFNF